jgi:hypothetical protein
LAVYGNHYWRIENARGIAESHFDLVRIRAVRAEVLWGVGGLENCVGDELNQALSALEKIARYEQRTRSRLRRRLEAI